MTGVKAPRRTLISKGGTRTPNGIQSDADIYRIGSRIGHFELIEKAGVYYTRNDVLWTESLGRLRNDTEAMAVWQGWLRSHGVIA